MKKINTSIESVMEKIVKNAWEDPAARIAMVQGGQEFYLKNLKPKMENTEPMVITEEFMDGQYLP
jgi:hypothetical protein